MNIQQRNSKSTDKSFKQLFSISFWVYTITAALLVVSTSLLTNSLASWLLEKVFLHDIIELFAKLAIQLPIGYLTGKYLISHMLDFLFSEKIVSVHFASSKLLSVTAFLYSNRIQKEVFEPIDSDWQEEYFEALFKKEIWKAHWIDIRYTYAFTVAMWQKSPIGDLIEFISKIAK